mmetsp:Transcript_23975/g.66652  ORF Transcript_23975/g.66652 Transcript_23975/m.66652 type:complete len:210 (-) Transcript_23975:126-755(-)
MPSLSARLVRPRAQLDANDDHVGLARLHAAAGRISTMRSGNSCGYDSGFCRRSCVDRVLGCCAARGSSDPRGRGHGGLAASSRSELHHARLWGHGSDGRGARRWRRFHRAEACQGQQASSFRAQGQRVLGEWICADCGYIYNERVYGSKFEDLQAGYKCPSCSAPRRRFARKLGDKVGTTLDGGDGPILIFSAICLLVVLGVAVISNSD